MISVFDGNNVDERDMKQHTQMASQKVNRTMFNMSDRSHTRLEETTAQF